MSVRLLFLGDVVGEAGRRIVRRAVPLLRAARAIDVVVVNAENAAGGSGLDRKCFGQLSAAGVDAMTLGDHAFRRKGVFDLFREQAPVCRPCNFPPDAPGPGHVVVQAGGVKVAVVNVQGRVFMKAVDCPLRALDRELDLLEDDVRIRLVDVHAEATAEKQTVLRHLAGRVTAVLGTHTHVPTADAEIVAGTAFQCDVGMCGGHDGVIGREVEPVLSSAWDFRPRRFAVAAGDPRIGGALVECDPDTGRAAAIESLRLTAADLDRLEAGASPPRP